MRCLIAALIGMTLLPGCGEDGETQEAGVIGGVCTHDDQCENALLCLYGRCRPECQFDRDCADGSVCVASPDDPDLRVCTLPDEGSCESASCPAGLVCSSDGVCLEGCDDPDDCATGRVCVDGVCVQDTGGSG